jgi:hypothetical protein
MGEEDVTLEALAEIAGANNRAWHTAVEFRGRCLIGCKSRKMLNTKNLLAALRWVDYHREGVEHVGNLLEKQQGSGQIVATWPGTSSNGEETQP